MKRIFGLSGHKILYNRQFLMSKNSFLLAFFPLPQSSLNAFSKRICQESSTSAREDKSCVNTGQGIR